MNNLSFFISSLIIILIPGTGVIYTISTALLHGKKSGIYAAFGCTAGILPHLSIYLFLSCFMYHLNNSLFFIVKIAGALYLIYLGCSMIQNTNRISFEKADTQLDRKVIICKAILINLLNPKLTIFFFAFLPQYVNHSANHYFLRSSFLGILFMLLTFIVFVLYSILAGFTKYFFEKSVSRQKTIQIVFGCIFIAFALQLSFSSI